MESVTVTIGDRVLYDELVHRSAKQASQILIVTKPGGTSGGRSCVVVAFDAEIDGKVVRVQATTTARALAQATEVLRSVVTREDEAAARGGRAR